MKANELMVGNLVIFSEDQTIFKVEEISTTGLAVSNENESTWIEIDQFQPIPLDEEWLKRFDWQLISNINYYFNSYFSIDIYGHVYYQNDYTGLNIYTVHQLQNLYFALTGKELTIN